MDCFFRDGMKTGREAPEFSVMERTMIQSDIINSAPGLTDAYKVDVSRGGRIGRISSE